MMPKKFDREHEKHTVVMGPTDMLVQHITNECGECPGYDDPNECSLRHLIRAELRRRRSLSTNRHGLETMQRTVFGLMMED